jgi:putative transposase
MTDIAVRHHGTPFGRATVHTVTRHSHPKARPETVDAPPAPTGIDYLNLVAGQHHGRAGQAINFHALTTEATTPEPAPVSEPGQVPGQLPLLDEPTLGRKGAQQ